MKNLHLVYTDNPSRLFYLASNLHLEQGQLITPKNHQHIYITSDEEIKKGDWCINLNSSYEHKELCRIDNQIELERYAQKIGNDCKKIILTTNQDLISDGVQAINDEFLEYFIKNPTCEYVEVKKRYSDFTVDPFVGYKIIIPQEELKSFSDFSDKFFGTTSQEDLLQQIITASKIPKKYFGIEESKQETLEEAAKEFAKNYSIYPTAQDDTEYGFKHGAKWMLEKLQDFDTWKEWKNK
jgi:hypothetical protein